MRVETEPLATSYDVYVGTIGSWHASAPVAPASCHVRTGVNNGDGTTTLLFSAPLGSWMLVSASNTWGEGPLGNDSLGADRTLRGAWTRCGGD